MFPAIDPMQKSGLQSLKFLSFRRLTARAGQTSCTSEELICRLSPICDGMLESGALSA